MNEVSEDWTDWTAESWDDDDYWWHDQWPESCDGQWGVSQTWWDDGSDGMATGMDIPGNRDQSKVRNRVQVTTIGLMSKRLAVSAA